MTKKYLYFQPEYVRKFKCNGAKCDARCCKNWRIEIDAQTHAQYSRIQPKINAQEILSHIKFNPDTRKYFVDMNDKKFCPFLTEKNLCRLQLKYGENFLSLTCATFPRFTRNFGKFFERALSLTCPVAAETILFRDAPLKFEWIELWEDPAAKVGILPSPVPQKLISYFVDIQIAMISILQERTLSIDQRLIVLGFFLDRLDEIISDGFDDDATTKLIAAYESKNFLSRQVPRMLAAVTFDAKKFIGQILGLLETICGGKNLGDNEKFLDALIETLKIFPDGSGKVSVTKIAANYERLADKRKIFQARYATFSENFLVNEIFLTCFPWKFKMSFAKNFGVFVAEYKIFELLTFSAAQKNLDGKDDLLKLVDWFTNQTDHGSDFNLKILDNIPDDIFSVTETFLEAH